ncbi:hypothetical protein Esti_005832 [Eimeria stiedai]
MQQQQQQQREVFNCISLSPPPAATMVQLRELGSGVLYFDNNATTPVEPAVFEALAPFLQARFGNPSSKHPLGVAAASAVAQARAQIASCLEVVDPSAIFFTSGATESINWALRSALKLSRHPAACNRCSSCCCCCCRILYNCCAVLSPLETAVVSLPLANGEIGSVQPIAEVVSLVRRLSPNAVVHSDASQAMGKVPVHPVNLGVDLLTIAGHKIYAPKGVGALYIRQGLRLEPLILGGGQERGLRGGTENVAFMVALAKACQLVQQSWAASPRDTSQAAVSAAAAAPAAEVPHPAKLKSGDGLDQLPPHPSHLGFVARVFIEAFWTSLEEETGLDRQQLGEAVRLNGPLGSTDHSVEAQWLPGTVHLSVRGANGFEIACGLAVSLSPLSSSRGRQLRIDRHVEAAAVVTETYTSREIPGLPLPRGLQLGSCDPTVSGGSLLQEKEGLFVSAGVSCHQGAECSATLKAMGIEELWGLGALRISVGRRTTPGEAVEAAGRLARFLVLRNFINGRTHAAAP